MKFGADLIRSVRGEGYTIDLPIDAIYAQTLNERFNSAMNAYDIYMNRPVDPAPLSEEKPA